MIDLSKAQRKLLKKIINSNINYEDLNTTEQSALVFLKEHKFINYNLEVDVSAGIYTPTYIINNIVPTEYGKAELFAHNKSDSRFRIPLIISILAIIISLIALYFTYIGTK